MLVNLEFDNGSYRFLTKISYNRYLKNHRLFSLSIKINLEGV